MDYLVLLVTELLAFMSVDESQTSILVFIRISS